MGTVVAEPVTFRPIVGGFRIGDALVIRRVGIEQVHAILGRPDGVSAWRLAGGSPWREPTAIEAERVRQGVRHNIRNALSALVAKSETEAIGLHLLDSIQTGATCRYSGQWHWKL